MTRRSKLIGSFLTLSVCLSLLGTVRSVDAVTGSLTPSEREMIMLKASGSMWGATEDAFSLHAFSLKSDRGVALWLDSAPESIVLLNPENKTFLRESLTEYLSDNEYGLHLPLKFDSTQAKASFLPDGKPSTEVVYKKKLSSGLERDIVNIKCLDGIKLPPKLLHAWCAIMLTESSNLFPVNLKTRPSHRRHQESARSTAWRELVTYHSITITALEKNRFKIPADFKRAEDKSAFYLSSNGVLKKQDIDDLFRGELK